MAMIAVMPPRLPWSPLGNLAAAGDEAPAEQSRAAQLCTDANVTALAPAPARAASPVLMPVPLRPGPLRMSSRSSRSGSRSSGSHAPVSPLRSPLPASSALLGSSGSQSQTQTQTSGAPTIASFHDSDPLVGSHPISPSTSSASSVNTIRASPTNPPQSSSSSSQQSGNSESSPAQRQAKHQKTPPNSPPPALWPVGRSCSTSTQGASQIEPHPPTSGHSSAVTTPPRVSAYQAPLRTTTPHPPGFFLIERLQSRSESNRPAPLLVMAAAATLTSASAQSQGSIAMAATTQGTATPAHPSASNGGVRDFAYSPQASPLTALPPLPRLSSQEGQLNAAQNDGGLEVASSSSRRPSQQPVAPGSPSPSPNTSNFLISPSPRLSTGPQGQFQRESSESELGHGSESGSGYPSASYRKSAKAAAKRKPSPPELLVIVRPPPSKERNPNNLQIQLVVPQASSSSPSGPSQPVPKSPGEQPPESPSRESASGSVMEAPELKRRGSSSSAKSGRSQMTSMSTASSNASGRRVTPLYNLGFHSIMPTSVSDAGTDQRVAKFGKKGVEIDGFGHLEAHNLVFGLNDVATLEHGASVLNGTAEGAGKPTPSSASGEEYVAPAGLPEGKRASDPGVEVPVPANAEPPTSFESMTPEAQAPDSVSSKLKRRFKGLSINAGDGGSSQNPALSLKNLANSNQSTAGSAIGSFFSGLSGKSNKGNNAAPPDRSTAHSTTGATAATTAASKVSAGGEAGLLSWGAGLTATGKRKQGYFWTVKKLTRHVGDEHGNPPAVPMTADGLNPTLHRIWKSFNLANRGGGTEKHPHPSEITWRVEWTREARMPSISASARSDAGSRSGHGHGKAATEAAAGSKKNSQRRFSGSNSLAPPSSGTSANGKPSSRRFSQLSTQRSTWSLRRSAELSDRGSSSAHSDHAVDDDEEEQQDDGADSDPEDSETPWSCHLVLSSSTRIPIGTVSPAPHHPKVVAQLAVPFPLPDLSQTGLCADQAGLTREELKDMICVTCLHLVVREGFGGMAKVKR